MNLQALNLFIDRSDCTHLQKDILKRKLRKMDKKGTLSFEGLPMEWRWRLCNARFYNGDFENWDGWQFRSDWSKSLYLLDLPLWKGEKGKITVLGEQGLGDEIAYASCLPDLIKYVGEDNVTFECQKRLVPVFECAFGIECIPRRNLDVVREGAVAALGDLPRFFRKSLVSFPGVRYLNTDPKRQLYWHSWLRDQGLPPYIGVAWKARQGELPPEELRVDGTLIDLQYGEDPVFTQPPLDPIEDFAEQINLISVLDKVISPPMSVVHAAGALGIPCDVILPPLTKEYFETQDRLDWAFGKTCPWYKSIKIYRSLNDWKTQRA